MTGVFNIVRETSIVDQGTSYSQIVAAKYPTTETWGNQVIKRLQAWGFNTVAEYGETYVYPFGRPSGATLAPMVTMLKSTTYAFTNQGGYAPGPVKGLVDCQAAGFTGYPGEGPPDVYDANFDAYVGGRLAGTAGDAFWSQTLTSPWIIGITVDDTDYLTGFGPGTEVPAPDGSVASHVGYLALCASPTKTSSAHYGVTYADTVVHTKTALQTFLQGRYASIGALNTAWGSNYTTFGSASGGWGIGTGLMDEDGRHTAWLGSRDGTLTAAPASVVADLNVFLGQYATQYFTVTTTRVHQYAPGRLVFGPATLNGHGGLTRGPILQAAAASVDVIQAGLTSSAVLTATQAYTGNVPLVTWEGAPANPDSSLWRYPNPATGPVASYALQADRGTGYASRVSFLLACPRVVGLKWWSWVDNWSEKINWGLVSFRDNAYNGLEAKIAAGIDPWGYTTGGEEHDYGNFLSSAINANATIEGALSTGGTMAGTINVSASATSLPTGTYAARVQILNGTTVVVANTSATVAVTATPPPPPAMAVPTATAA